MRLLFAAKNPKLLGGPFVDLDGKQVEEIRALRDRIKLDREPLVKLSTATLGVLDEMLRAHAKGYSLHSLYPEVPEIIKACQEQGIIAERLFGDKEILLETRMASSSAVVSPGWLCG